MATPANGWLPAPVGVVPGLSLPPPAGPAGAGPTDLLVYRVAVPDLASSKAAITALLTPEERARAARFRQPTDRRRFVVGRASLRYLLGQQLGQAPAQITLVLNAFGKPQLPAPAPLHFNIAHSGD